MYTIIWILFAISAGITEISALRNRTPGDTLSEHIWKVTRVDDARPTVGVWVLRAVIALVMVWLAGHFSMGWWTPSDPWPW